MKGASRMWGRAQKQIEEQVWDTLPSRCLSDSQLETFTISLITFKAHKCGEGYGKRFRNYQHVVVVKSKKKKKSKQEYDDDTLQT